MTMSCFAGFVYYCFYDATATTEIYTLSLHDALPILVGGPLPQHVVDLLVAVNAARQRLVELDPAVVKLLNEARSEEHTSELQSRLHLVCRLLLEKKKSQLSEMIYVCIDC